MNDDSKQRTVLHAIVEDKPPKLLYTRETVRTIESPRE